MWKKSKNKLFQLFENNIFEDSIILTNQIEEFKKNPSNQPLRKSVKEKHKYNLTLLRVVIETVVVRSRLMTSAWEGEVLGEVGDDDDGDDENDDDDDDDIF